MESLESMTLRTCVSRAPVTGAIATVRAHVAPTMPISRLERKAQWLLEEGADPGQELGAVGAVEDAGVAGEGDRHQVAGGDLAVSHQRLLDDRPDGEDSGLR